MEYSYNLSKKKGRDAIVSVRETGTVKWFNASKCHGLISRDQGGDIFVSYDSFHDKESRFLIIGNRVEFIVVETAKSLQAQDLIVIG